MRSWKELQYQGTGSVGSEVEGVLDERSNWKKHFPSHYFWINQVDTEMQGCFGETSSRVPYCFLTNTTGHIFKKIEYNYLFVLVKLSSIVIHLELRQDVSRGKRLLKDLCYTCTFSVKTCKCVLVNTDVTLLWKKKHHDQKLRKYQPTVTKMSMHSKCCRNF